jgi:septin family protein
MYPWGVVELENDEHCDYLKLRTMLMYELYLLHLLTYSLAHTCKIFKKSHMICITRTTEPLDWILRILLNLSANRVRFIKKKKSKRVSPTFRKTIRQYRRKTARERSRAGSNASHARSNAEAA